MSRNAESRFAVNPTNLDMSRSKFKRPHSVKTTFNVGELIPFYVTEILPGDSVSIDTSKVVRMQPLVAPIMDNIYLDTYYFFVPNRLVWSHWKEFMGENTESAWLPTTEYAIPQLTSPSGGWNVGTIADYMGIPTGVSGLSLNALPFRGYALICNEWFRDENLTDPLYIPVTDSNVTGTNGSSYRTDVAKGGKPFIAAKLHDMFTSCLPAPQKGPDVTIPALGNAPVITGNINTGIDTTMPSMKFAVSGFSASAQKAQAGIGYVGTDTDPALALYGAPGTSNPIQASYKAVPNNLYADLGSATMASINALRTAFQIQKMLEKNAMGGTRYIELLKAHFGVTSPDSRLQRPEYLGGNRIPININQVLQTSATASGQTPLGTPGANSLTVDSHSDFTHSFTEHGFLFGLMVARYPHSYQQGINRQFLRKDKYDYYWPVFANLGNQAVKNAEIYAQGTSTDDDVFAYQEAWYDYRYFPNMVTGEMRSAATNSLDAWHLADEYSTLPTLSDGWIRENKSNPDRALLVNSSVSNQIFADLYVNEKITRVMPFYSIPGLIDHH